MRQIPDKQPDQSRQDEQKRIGEEMKALPDPHGVSQHPHQRSGDREENPEEQRLERQNHCSAELFSTRADSLSITAVPGQDRIGGRQAK
jgi:hypothetical protein